MKGKVNVSEFPIYTISHSVFMHRRETSTANKLHRVSDRALRSFHLHPAHLSSEQREDHTIPNGWFKLVLNQDKKKFLNVNSSQSLSCFGLRLAQRRGLRAYSPQVGSLEEGKGKEKTAESDSRRFRGFCTVYLLGTSHHMAFASSSTLGVLSREPQEKVAMEDLSSRFNQRPNDKVTQAQSMQCGNCAMYLLLLSVVGSLSVAGISLLPLHPSDHIPVVLGAWLSALGLVFFVSLFALLNHVGLKTKIGQRCRKKYQLTIGEVLDISNKIVSAVQAVLSCFTGVVVCAWSCTRNFLRSSHFMSEAYAWFGAAYFFYDIWSMYKIHLCTAVNGAISGGVNGEKQHSLLRKIGDYIVTQPMILLHHVFIGSFGFLVIVYLRGGLGDCVFGFIYLMELSTPFVSIRGILSKLKMKASKMYVINGLTMLLTFFLCRVAMLPYVMYMYSELINQSLWEAAKGLPTGCKVGIAFLTIPQIYWFLLMTKGAIGVFVQKRVHSNGISHHKNLSVGSGDSVS